ncbi:hypothetical protein COEREDRAFT_84242 [Coemansia reversa NRRL 1564]|uniref:Uncharacterized protein n=1 Tax=Coemansia reversa (strain ATCC 12441 / NRRL 1564) TaxID=763665 RepID=A0A2G5BKS9_COERN|nr:hypothetical protein COEREDRAFT_84242 [Coemansia reversa NRRL 1564]|eukprot:PIA19613.1 hypothetical protein COEREDRAFT_84242 [Coemansia reversa NRRL 1564]
MSQVVNNPWLCELFAKGIPLGKVNNKDGGRVQAFHFLRTDEEYPVTCEISDKHNFMPAAFSKRALKAFEKARGQPIVSMSGVILLIHRFQLQLFAGDTDNGESHANNDMRKKKNGANNDKDSKILSCCPSRIRKAGAPQAWMLITKFGYIGGEGNAIFDEPRHITHDLRVRSRLEALLAGMIRPKTNLLAKEHEPQDLQCGMPILKPDVVADDVTEKRKQYEQGSAPSNTIAGHVQKKQRPESVSSSPPFTSSIPRIELFSTQYGPLSTSAPQSSVETGNSCPTIEQVPIVSDVEAAWECIALWQALYIQTACLPLMPFHGVCETTTETAIADSSREMVPNIPTYSNSITIENDHAHAPRHGQPSGWNQHVSTGLGASPHRLNTEYQEPRRISISRASAAAPLPLPQKTPDNLHGLLMPQGAGLLRSTDMMDVMFGRIESSPPLGDDYDLGKYGSNNSKGIDTSMLLD